ncbi:RNA polymerase sigma factor [Paenibacillus guangzhouensis]|uniref:RNA polymerase sigma factor n=1 Tax=Paenibacillus guangzhouensis TaxID=1473112 RepID=UPI0012670719|nr:sigma-70 family RNA polymerase sigma factor [Paenibacillus guangzhouensis]
MARIRRGESAAFRQLIDRFHGHIFQVAYSVVRDRTDAEDIAQNVFIQIHRSLPQYESKGLKTWISRIALNKAIDYKRKLNRRREEVVEDVEVAEGNRPFVASSIENDVLTEVIHRDRQARIRAQLDLIPELHRQMIESYYLEEKSYDQIATECNISLKTVESRLYRARQWLRTHWKEEDWR